MDIITEQHVIRFLDHDPNILPAVIALPANSHDLVAILVRPLVHHRVVVSQVIRPGGILRTKPHPQLVRGKAVILLALLLVGADLAPSVPLVVAYRLCHSCRAAAELVRRWTQHP